MNPLSRRSFFDHVGAGLYGTALATLLTRDLYAKPHHTQSLALDTRPRRPHFAPRAKAVIQLCMQGGPSQVDLFDPKPALNKFHGKDAPEEFTKVAPAGRSMKGKIMRSHWQFAQHGQGGAWVSELLPHTAKVIDEIAIIRSMYNVPRPPHPRRMDHLWPRQRKPKPARLRRPLRPQEPPARQRRRELDERLPASPLSGHPGQKRGHTHAAP